MAGRAQPPTVCPWCGQPLLNRDAIAHLRRAEAQRTNQIRKEEQRLAREAADRRVASIRQQAVRDARREVDKEIRSLQRKANRLKEDLEAKERDLERLSGAERGEMSEEDLYRALGRERAFRDDEIARQPRGRKGTDILHEVFYRVRGERRRAGLILWECKDTNRWETRFLRQAAGQAELHGTPHVVIVTRVLPPKQKTLCVQDHRVICSPGAVLPLAHILRGMVIETHRAGLSSEGQARKTAALYRYLAGGEFRRAFEYITARTETLNRILENERKRHHTQWSKRHAHYAEIAGKVTELDEHIRGIIERSALDRKVIRLNDARALVSKTRRPKSVRRH